VHRPFSHLHETQEENPRAKAERERRWLEENQAALAAYNARICRDGLLSDEAGV
jgi:post-segregation antitoxin (ccd killing protein)